MKIKNKFLIKRVPDTFLVYDKNFNINVAKWLLEFSSLSYIEDEKIIVEELKKCENFKLEKLIIVDDAECMILSYDDIIIVSFSGTKINEIDDIVNDLKFWHSKLENYKIHAGFFEYYKKLKFPVLRKILELRKNKKNVYWCGHSLGGALAVIFSLTFGEGVVYTYGQPKVGTNKFVKEFINKKINLYRICNDFDIIPKLPPKIFGYNHCGENIIFKIYFNFLSLKNIKKIFFYKFIFSVYDAIPIFKFLFFIFNIDKFILFHSLNMYRKILWFYEKSFLDLKN